MSNHIENQLKIRGFFQNTVSQIYYAIRQKRDISSGGEVDDAKMEFSVVRGKLMIMPYNSHVYCMEPVSCLFQRWAK